MENKNYAYITLLSNEEYLYCVFGLYASWSFQKHQYPFYCAVTSDISQNTLDILHNVGISTILLEDLVYSEQMRKNNEEKHMSLSFVRAMPKLRIWSLNQFDKIVYLDADTVVLQNLDDLFNYPHMAGVVDCAFLNADKADWEVKDDRWFRYFNAGVLVIEPKEDETEHFIRFMENLPLDRNWSDQAILSAYYRNWPETHKLHLPVYYNVLVSVLDLYLEYGWFNSKDIKLIHFVDRYKPITRLWNGKKIRLPKNKQALINSVIACFSLIDDFITQNKEAGRLPKDFKLVQDLEGEEKVNKN